MLAATVSRIITQQLLAPFIFLNGHPLFDEVVSLRADLDLQVLVKDPNVVKQSLNTQYLFARLDVEMTEGQQTTTVVYSSLEVFYRSELVEQSHHDFVGTLLRYILDEHFLPYFLLRSH